MFDRYFVALQTNKHPVIDWCDEDYYGTFASIEEANNWIDKERAADGYPKGYRFVVKRLNRP